MSSAQAKAIEFEVLPPERWGEVSRLKSAGIQFAMRVGVPASHLPDREEKRGRLKLGGALAADALVGYGGYQVGKSALAVRRALAKVAPHVEAAAENAAAVTGAVRKVGAPLAKVRKLFRMSAVQRTVAFAGESVAQNRYRKAIREQESNRAESNYARSGLAGAALGTLLRKPGMTRGRAALAGAAAGVATQAVLRAATSATKDKFGDRPLEAKRAERLPWQAGGVAAGVLAYRHVARKLAKVRGVIPMRARVVGTTEFAAVGSTIAARLRRAALSDGVLAGGALAGGITAADVVSSAVDRQPGQTTGDAVAHGAKKGLLYGTVLAGAEPILHAVLKRGVRKVALTERGRLVAFGGSQQLRGEKNRFVDPLDVAAGTTHAYAGDDMVDLPVRHAQVIRAALNKGRVYQRAGSRAGSLVRDAADAVAGRAKVDARGRPQKREWEKSWFKNAAGTAATGAALLGHAALMKQNPAYRAKVANLVRRGKSSANHLVPDLFPLSAKLSDVVALGLTAPDWDVRDQRGRSARVFAPGAQSRQRRSKEWHEKADNQRKLLGAAAVVAGVGGLLLGHKLGSASGIRNARTALAKKGWETRRAGAAENAVIERMKRRPPGGSPVS